MGSAILQTYASVLYALVSCGVEVRVSSNLPPPSVSLRALRSFIRPNSTDIRHAAISGWVSGGLSEVRGDAASLAANGMGFPHSVNRHGRGHWTRDKDRHLQGTRRSEGCARKCRLMVLRNSGSVSVHIKWL